VNSAEELNAVGRRFLPARLGIRVTATQQVPELAITVEMSVRPRHLAPHGYVHGGDIMLLAVNACYAGELDHLPCGAAGFLNV
jgi:acyl-coenzyme A thioesterase PaaI-like protein